MKKLYFILSTIIITSFVSCTKVDGIVDNPASPNARQSFVVFSPDTKTTLNGREVKWADGDEIRVVGYTEGVAPAEAIFEITSGQGTGKAVFSIKEGATLGTFDTYYAIYPAKELKLDSFPNKIEVKSAFDLTNQIAVENGYDPAFAIMTAKSTSSGELTFRHGVAYIGVQIPTGLNGVTTVQVSFANNATGKRPIYNATDGSVSSVESGATTVSASGSFVAGSYYYLPTPARASNPGDVTISFTKDGITVSKTTSSLTKTRLETGNVYDLGCPPISFTPVIVPVAPSKLAYDATNGSFTYSIANAPSTAVASASLQSGVTWISNVAVSGNTVSFDCEENTDTDERIAVITLSYAGAEDVAVTVTQGGAGASIKESHNWNFADYSDSQMQTITGLAADAKANAGQTWDFGNGLTMVTNSSSKWNKQTIGETAYKWVATGGKYGSNQKYFSFTTQSTGTITVLYASGGSASRALTVNAGGEETTDSANVSTGTSDLKTVTFSSVASGTILLYSKDDNVRIFSINYLED